MKLIQVDAGGATYWVAAHEGNEGEVRSMLVLCDGTDLEDETLALTELDEAAASTKHIRMDDAEGSRVNLWAHFSALVDAEVIACSEWP